MKLSGIIQLVRNDDSSVVQEKEYLCTSQKNAIIEAWHKMYGQYFTKQLHVVEVPYPDNYRLKKKPKKDIKSLYGNVRNNPNTSGFKKKH